MEIASDKETQNFLTSLWIRYAETIVDAISKYYDLSSEQRSALRDKFVRPNDWQVNILPPIAK